MFASDLFIQQPDGTSINVYCPRRSADAKGANPFAVHGTVVFMPFARKGMDRMVAQLEYSPDAGLYGTVTGAPTASDLQGFDVVPVVVSGAMSVRRTQFNFNPINVGAFVRAAKGEEDKIVLETANGDEDPLAVVISARSGATYIDVLFKTPIQRKD